MKRIRRVLHPTDFSPASKRAFDRAVELARANGRVLAIAPCPVMTVRGS